VRKICLLDDHVVMAFAGNYCHIRSFEWHIEIGGGKSLLE
jgi:hypothetical protein